MVWIIFSIAFWLSQYFGLGHSWLFSDLFGHYVVVWQPNSVWMCCVVAFSVYRLDNGTFFFIVWICG
jgi:hypothetical protein